MNLELQRKWFTDKSTIGELYVDGKFECYTLEDCVRSGEKVYGRTAIPAGTYRVIVSMSNRFKKLMPLLLNVPGFEGVRIHPGNTDADTEGCILVGMAKQKDSILWSRAAYRDLFPKIQSGGDVVINIQNTPVSN